MSGPTGPGRGHRPGAVWTGLPPGPRIAVVAIAVWIAAVVAVATGTVLGGGEADPGPVPGRAALPTDVAGPPLAAIADRPLFSASRRPDAPPPAPPMAPAVPPPPRDRQITLRGVYMDGATSKAFVLLPSQPEGLWVPLGAEVGGWRVAAVTAERVRFEAGDETFSAAMDPEAGHP